jgi:type II secretory pathway pseudopilin PulG
MPPTERRTAFTLIELVGVCAVLGLLLAVVAPAIGFQVQQARTANEANALRALAAAAQSSFESTDLESTNLAALPGSIPADVDPTAFSVSTDPQVMPSTTRASDWFAKLTRQLGDTPTIGEAPTSALQPRVAAVLMNADRNNRIFLLGPANETGQQRFLIVSLMAAPGQLALPPLPNPSNAQDPANLALFNDIWNTDWTNPASRLPPSWVSGLTTAQVQAWQGSPGSLARLCVQRVSCPKFSITVNNTHPTDVCTVYYNLNGTEAGNSAIVPANAGAFVIPGVYGGRLIQAYRGTAGPPAGQIFSQFILRDSSEITLQD